MPPPGSNPFSAERERRAQAAISPNPFTAERQRRADGPSAGFVFRERAARTVLNNLMAVPSAGGELLADAMSAIKAGVGRAAAVGANNARSLVGKERQPGPSFGERFTRAQENPSAAQTALRAIPRPTIEQVDAAIQSAPAVLPGGESPGEAYGRNLEQNAAERAALAEAHPFAARAGDIGGDVLSIFLARRSSGAGKAIRDLETRLAGRGAQATAATQSAAGDLAKAITPGMRSLARGGARSVEAGVEAAALDLLKDENADPLETAALASGGQLVGSGLISGGRALTTGKGIAVAAIGTLGFLQIVKSATPAGRDQILESAESAYAKITLAMGLGIGAAAIGATRYGRGNTALSDQTRMVLDGLATMHRGTTLSVLNDWTDGDEKERRDIERVLQAIAKDPEFKGTNDAQRALVRRLRDGAQLKPEKYETGGKF